MTAELLNRINWKTTGFGIGYVICKIIGAIFPVVSGVCEVLEPILVGGGFISTADSSRVQNVVRAVDTLLWKTNLDPETLTPIAAPVK